MIDYELFALKMHADHTQKPYDMSDELSEITTNTYVILGNKDMLFPFKRSAKNASRIPTLRDVCILENTGHGIETSLEALKIIKDTIRRDFLKIYKVL